MEKIDIGKTINCEREKLGKWKSGKKGISKKQNQEIEKWEKEN